MKTPISEKILCDVAGELDVDAIITLTDNEPEEWMEIENLTFSENERIEELKVSETDGEKKGFYAITVQKVGQESKPKEIMLQKTKTIQFEGIIAEIVSGLIKKKLVKQNNKLLIVADYSIAQRYNVALLILDVDKTLYRIGRFKLADKMASETIIETVISLAQEIGREGREGKKVGTLFVIGDEEELSSYTKQLIMNPFQGYEKKLLNIVQNQTLDETLKNFAQLDGAFIIDNEGHVLSAGTYLDVDTSNIKPFAGWGTKHLAATAITKETSAIAVLVSESGGAVKVFKNGRLVLKLR